MVPILFRDAQHKSAIYMSMMGRDSLGWVFPKMQISHDAVNEQPLFQRYNSTIYAAAVL